MHSLLFNTIENLLRRESLLGTISMFQFVYNILLEASSILWNLESGRRDLRSECLQKREYLTREVLDNVVPFQIS